MPDAQTELMHALYEEHAPAVWRYALRLTGDRARAEDIVQEVLLRAWKHPNVLDQSESSLGRGCSRSPGTSCSTSTAAPAPNVRSG